MLIRISRWLILLTMVISSMALAKRPIEFNDLFGMARVADPQISPDGQWIAYTVTRFDIEKNSKNSDIYLVSSDGKTVRQLTFSDKADFYPRWSPAGDELGFISTREGTAQIYVISMKGGEARRATDIPTEVNSFAWSPDGEYFAVATAMLPEASSPEESQKMVEEKEKNDGSGMEIEHLLYRHWNHWRKGKYSHVLLVQRDGTYLRDLTPGPYDTPPIDLGSSHDFVFSPDGKYLGFVKNTDPIVAISTNNNIWITPVDKVNQKQITTWKGNDNGPRYSPDGQYIAYLSMARPGFEADQQDLKIYNLQTGEERNLTEKLDRSVTDFVWAPDGKKLYFFVPNHGRHRLYEVDLQKDKLSLLLDKQFINEFDISPDGKFLVISRQAVNDPTELYRFDLKKKELTQLTFTNKERLAELDMNPLEEYWFTGAKNDSIQLFMVKPPQFDPNKKYPMVSLIHGGPQGSWGDDFHYRWNAEMFASPGYVAIMINFHGSRGYGQAFVDAVSKDWGGAPYDDIMIGTKWAADKFSFVDKDRIGAAGASYGGFMIDWIEGHNDEGLFKTLVCHDGVYEQVSEFGATEELWFPAWEFNGYPWQKGSLYEKWNPANFVEHFKTPILIVHGIKDFRVPYTQGLQAFTAVQLQHVDSKLLIFPDEDHFVQKPKNARQWWRNVYDWLGKYLKP
ncbi:MAG: S9 family peptidase [Calditrichia bacterium]